MVNYIHICPVLQIFFQIATAELKLTLKTSKLVGRVLAPPRFPDEVIRWTQIIGEAKDDEQKVEGKTPITGVFFGGHSRVVSILIDRLWYDCLCQLREIIERTE